MPMKKLTLEKMGEIAVDRGGECLSEEYSGTGVKLRWRCKEGHTWEAVPSSVRGGRCLSMEYVDEEFELSWMCSRGHAWVAAPRDVCEGKWRPQCGGRR